MKLKSLHEDFLVEEITSARPSRGPFAFYRLEKRGIGTPEAISAIIRDWNLSRKAVNYGGLKDRHAVTVQYLTIHKGPNQSHEDRSYKLEYLGQLSAPYHANHIEANRFSIRLRNLAHTDRIEMDRRCEAVETNGIVNYFDDQRFGSIGYSGELIAVPWCKGDYERVLFLAMAESNSHDRGREKEQKQIMREHWGDWVTLKQRLDRSHRRSVVTYLVDHPTGFKRAVALIRQDMRSLYLSAFQSWVWNRWLSQLIREGLGEENCISYQSRCGDLCIPKGGASLRPIDKLRTSELPLPSSRQHDWDESTLPSLDAILASLGLTRREMRLKYPRDSFFSKGFRRTWLKPASFQYRWSNDELNSQRLALDLSFELPRGCYATMVVRAISSSRWDTEDDQFSLEAEHDDNDEQSTDTD
jgi:tRNA pseudouridine13 synthase